MAEQNLKEKTAKGILWGGINNGGQQVLNLVFGIFLGRLLSPADYGMVGMLTIFSLLAGALQESGFISALNRKKDITQEDYNAVFWFNVLCGAVLYVILFFCAPLIADFSTSQNSCRWRDSRSSTSCLQVGAPRRVPCSSEICA